MPDGKIKKKKARIYKNLVGFVRNVKKQEVERIILDKMIH